MFRLQKISLLFALLVTVTPIVNAGELGKSIKAVDGSSESAFESVQAETDKLLKKLVEIQPLYAIDAEKFYQEVDGSLAPFIDFQGFSRGVMAKYYRRATDEQKERFVTTFRTALVHTYGSALAEFDNEKIVVKPDDGPQKRPKKAKVKLEIYAKDGTIYPVDYSMVLIGDRWMLRNVVINGINIGLQFRSQFSAYMQQYKNNIDEVIDHWNVDV